MIKEQLLPNEQIIKSSTKGDFILTNLRVIYKNKGWDYWEYNTISLEDISSIEGFYRGLKILLIIAALILLASLAIVIGSGEGAAAAGILLALVFFALWWFTRATVIYIEPNGGRRIKFRIKKHNKKNTEDLLWNIQMAKMNRVNSLYKSSF